MGATTANMMYFVGPRANTMWSSVGWSMAATQVGLSFFSCYKRKDTKEQLQFIKEDLEQVKHCDTQLHKLLDAVANAEERIESILRKPAPEETPELEELLNHGGNRLMSWFRK